MAVKERLIEEAIATKDIWKIREMALSNGGLLNGMLLLMLVVCVEVAGFLQITVR